MGALCMVRAQQSPNPGIGDLGLPSWMHPCLPRLGCMINAQEERSYPLGHFDAGRQNKTYRTKSEFCLGFARTSKARTIQELLPFWEGI